MLDNCSFHFDNHCFMRVQQITGLLEKIIHQNVCSLQKQFFGVSNELSDPS